MKLLSLTLAFALAACDDSVAAPAPDRGVRVAIANVSFLHVPDYLARAEFAVRNEAGENAWLNRCGDVVGRTLERRDGDRWVEVRRDDVVCIAVLPAVPLELAPRAQYLDALFIPAPAPTASASPTRSVPPTRCGSPTRPPSPSSDAPVTLPPLA